MGRKNKNIVIAVIALMAATSLFACISQTTEGAAGDVCKITVGTETKYYDDFGEALDEVRTGQTIMLLKDITYNETIYFYSAGSITFDLNGYVLNATAGLSA